MISALSTRLRDLSNEVLADFQTPMPSHPFGWKDVLTFFLINTSLMSFYYWGSTRFFRRTLNKSAIAWLELQPDDVLYGILPRGWWAIAGIVFRMLIPMLFVVFVYKDEIKEYGYRLKGNVAHGLTYLKLYGLMFPLVIGFSYTQGFQKQYPFYKKSFLGIEHFLAHEITYGLHFLALEAFFRGFALFILAKRFGYYAIFIMTIPYCMIHFGKPAPETFGAIIAGIALGYLALKSKSWLYGALLHWGIGFTMDLASILHQGGFKN